MEQDTYFKFKYLFFYNSIISRSEMNKHDNGNCNNN